MTYLRRSGLSVPPLELRQVHAVGVRHGGAEVVARDRLPVVALEIEIHPLAESGRAEKGVVHPNDLRAVWSSVVISGHQLSSVVISGTSE